MEKKMKNDEKTVLIGNMETGYSYVTPKESEEIRINNDREIIKEHDKCQTKRRLMEDFQDTLTKMFLYSEHSNIMLRNKSVEIIKVIFNNPATIVFWSDGEKTVVKCSIDEAFDEEKGLSMAISKRVLGNNGNYYNEFKKWLPKIEVSCGGKNCDECDDFDCKNTPDDEDKDVTIGVIKTYSDIDEPIKKTFVGDE